MEVIYTGLHQTPEQIVDTAIQEDADAIGLSILSGAHNTLFARVLELLKERDAEDIKVFGGGIIPEDDIAPSRPRASPRSSPRAPPPPRSSTGSTPTSARRSPSGGGQAGGASSPSIAARRRSVDTSRWKASDQ